MKKYLLMIAFVACSVFNLSAQEGIQFQHCSWNEAMEMAKQQNKLVFVDFYTQWCGPCRNMATKVFTLYSVGSFYNDHFICMKIDAENGEGPELAKKYGVRSFPTYFFIDPATGDFVHKSSGNQPAEDFLFTGKSALDPKTRSVYLEKEYAAGTNDMQTLIDYAMYKGSRFDRATVNAICSKLQGNPEFTLKNEKVWVLFEKYAGDPKNVLFSELLADLDGFRKLYGTKRVDMKLFHAFQFSNDKEALASLPEFEGKDLILLSKKQSDAQRSGNIQDAIRYTDSLMSYKGALEAECMRILYYVGRSNLYGEHSAEWNDKCLEVSRYVAYNHPDRDDVNIHQVYAEQLEKKLERLGKAQAAPRFGAQEYSMRPRDLKPKPKRH